MVPTHVLIIPLYLLMTKAGMFDTYWALILPFLVSPIGVFMVRQYFAGIPESLVADCAAVRRAEEPALPERQTARLENCSSQDSGDQGQADAPGSGFRVWGAVLQRDDR